MGQRDQIKLERPELETALQGNFDQLNLIQKSRFRQSVFHQPHREGRCVNRAAKTWPKARERAHMVLVRVGQDNAEELVLAILDELRVGHNDVHARCACISEGHAQIDNHPLALACAAIAEQVEVHSDLAGPSEREEYKVFFSLSHSVYSSSRFPADPGSSDRRQNAGLFRWPLQTGWQRRPFRSR